MLYFKGQLNGKKISEYNDKETCKLQFLVPADGDGAIELLEIKVPDGVSHAKYKKGENVEIPVEYSVFKEKVYFRVSEAA